MVVEQPIEQQVLPTRGDRIEVEITEMGGGSIKWTLQYHPSSLLSVPLPVLET